jgi:hypothetical protein
VNIPFKIFVLKRIIAKGQASVADPGCLSRIPDLDFCPSRIQKQQQKRGVKTNLLSSFFCSHKNHKIVSYINFELAKKNLASLLRIIELSTPKIAIKLSKI